MVENKNQNRVLLKIKGSSFITDEQKALYSSVVPKLSGEALKDLEAIFDDYEQKKSTMDDQLAGAKSEAITSFIEKAKGFEKTEQKAAVALEEKAGSDSADSILEKSIKNI